MQNRAFTTLKFDVTDGIATVMFNREKDTNAFSRNMTLELMDICKWL